MRFKKIMTWVVLFCTIAYMQGCYSVSYLEPQQLEPHTTYDIQKVETLSGEVYEFVRGARFVDGAIIGHTKERGLMKVPIEEVSIVYVRKLDAQETCLGAIVCVGLSYLILGFVLVQVIWD